MSKRIRTFVPHKLLRVESGVELLDSLPLFSSDLVWLIAVYAFPIAPDNLRKDILQKTQGVRDVLEWKSFGAWPCHSIVRQRGDNSWTMIDHIIGFFGVTNPHREVGFSGIPDWMITHEYESRKVTSGSFKCPSWIWLQLCVERHGSLSYM